jgi:hypothetical protein
MKHPPIVPTARQISNAKKKWCCQLEGACACVKKKKWLPTTGPVIIPTDKQHEDLGDFIKATTPILETSPILEGRDYATAPLFIPSLGILFSKIDVAYAQAQPDGLLRELLTPLKSVLDEMFNPPHDALILACYLCPATKDLIFAGGLQGVNVQVAHELLRKEAIKAGSAFLRREFQQKVGMEGEEVKGDEMEVVDGDDEKAGESGGQGDYLLSQLEKLRGEKDDAEDDNTYESKYDIMKKRVELQAVDYKHLPVLRQPPKGSSENFWSNDENRVRFKDLLPVVRAHMNMQVANGRSLLFSFALVFTLRTICSKFHCFHSFDHFLLY